MFVVDLTERPSLSGFVITRMEARLPNRIILDWLDPRSLSSEEVAVGTLIFFNARIECFTFVCSDMVGEIESYETFSLHDDPVFRSRIRIALVEGTLDIIYRLAIVHQSSAQIARV